MTTQAKEAQATVQAKVTEVFGSLDAADLKKLGESGQDLALRSVGIAAEYAVRARETYEKAAVHVSRPRRTWRGETADEIAEIAAVVEAEPKAAPAPKSEPKPTAVKPAPAAKSATPATARSAGTKPAPAEAKAAPAEKAPAPRKRTADHPVICRPRVMKPRPGTSDPAGMGHLYLAGGRGRGHDKHHPRTPRARPCHVAPLTFLGTEFLGRDSSGGSSRSAGGGKSR
ncbi:hypothetical protein SMICM17S_00195 [Streptomyces microflavus]